MSRLTDVFPPGVNPEYPGVYRTSPYDPTATQWPIASFQYWNGSHWGGWVVDIEDAWRDRKLFSMRQNPWWAGLALPPMTDWFPEHIPPVHVGVYEVDRADKDGRAFAHWDGRTWGLVFWEHLNGGVHNAIAQAAREQLRYPASMRFAWRGLEYDITLKT